MLDPKVHQAHQAQPVHLDQLGQMVKKDEKEQGVLLVLRESEGAEDYQDPLGLQVRLVNRHNMQQATAVDVN